MSGTGFILLINSVVKDHLLRAGAREKNRFKQKLEYLENGIWDSGVKVKKLRGISNKVIFEARLSKGERILFTLGRYDGSTAVYVWGIVKHDDVSKESENILPDNTPFLQFEPFEEEELTEIVIDELPEDRFSQENIEEKIPEDYGPQRWHALTDEEWKRLLPAGAQDNVELPLFLTEDQRTVLEMEPPVLLSGTAGSGKTTIAVYYLLRREFLKARALFLTYSPFLKRFSERIYDGLVSLTDLEKGAPKPRFTTLGDLLKEITRIDRRGLGRGGEVRLREFGEIFSSHSLAKKYDAELVWEEIRSIIKGAKPPLSARTCGKLASSWLSGGISRGSLGELRDYLLSLKHFELIVKIERYIEKKTGYSSYDEFASDVELGRQAARGEAPFVLEEIVKIVEKKARSFTTPLLSYEEYLMLGKKRAPNFLYDRHEIYSIAEYYQGKLEERGSWDEIDLTRRALQLLHGDGAGGESAGGDAFLYDLVVCDEVQDFADIQLSLIFKLTRSCRRILLAGDTKQIINPSGFRWEEVKDKFYERGVQVPEVRLLNLNFRCVGNIVKLSNALLDLKAKLVGLQGTEVREKWKFNGRPPCLLYGLAEEDVLQRVGITGAGQVFLTRTASESSRLKGLLKSELVFTIEEAKGLEFDSVLLWKFCRDTKAEKIWRTIKEEHPLDLSRLPHVRHEINLLYVAATRARNTLVVYDGEKPSDVWEVDSLRRLLHWTRNKEDVLTVWQRVSSPREWEKQGDYFFEREHYTAAVECYRNAGNSDKVEIAEAFILEEKGEREKAAVLLEKHGYTERAALNFERAGRYERATELWKALGDADRAHLCWIELCEREGDYDHAAAEWEKRGDRGRALKNWEKAGNHPKVAECFLSQKRYEEAASSFEKAGLVGEACTLYKKLKKFEKAAELYFGAGDFRSALALFKKSKSAKGLVRCYESLGDRYAAGRIHEKTGDVVRAIECFTLFAGESEANRKLVQKEAEEFSMGRSILKSALRYSSIGRYELSVPIFLKKGYEDLAARDMEKIEDPLVRSACYGEMGDYYRAAIELEASAIPDIELRVEETLARYIHPNSRYDRKRAESLFQEGSNCLQKGDLEKALRRFKVIRFPRGLLDTYLRMNRDEEALRYFFKNGMLEEVRLFVDERKELSVSPDLVKFIKNTLFGRGVVYYGEKQETLDTIVKLLGSCFELRQDSETRRLINGIMSDMSLYYTFKSEDVFPEAFLSLALDLDNYNALFEVLRWRCYGRRKRPIARPAGAFLEKMKIKADERGDMYLEAIHAYFFDAARFEEIAKSAIEAGPCSYRLFAESALSYGKSIDYLSGEGQFEPAARIARQHGNRDLAGKIYEGAGDFLAAGREYRDGKNFTDALRCFEKVGAPREIARVHERMKEYGRALEIWRALGKKREEQRVWKKMMQQKQDEDQLTIF
jgi:tetratricopeptide (TPR) repeat protein